MIPLLVSEKVWYYVFRQKITDVNNEYRKKYELTNGILLRRFGSFPKWFYYNRRCYSHGDRILRPKLHSNILDYIEKIVRFIRYNIFNYVTLCERTCEDVGPLPEKYWYSSGKNSLYGYF
ncbi:MAG: hypothetical protein WD512_12205 [Candidatus Paceibacterota bacterium]